MNPHTRRVALVDGGTSRIAPAIAISLGARDCDVVFAGHQDDCGPQIAEFGSDAGPKLCTIELRSSRPDDRAALVDIVKTRFGRLDVLVIVSDASSPDADILEITDEDLGEMLAEELKGPYFLTQAVARWMLEQQAADCMYSGAVINVGPAKKDRTMWSVGSCIAAAGRGMATQLWAHRLVSAGIAVFDVRPGIIADDDRVAGARSAETGQENLLGNRAGTSRDVAQVVARLACGELPYCTGNVVHVDGGFTQRRL